DRELRGRYELSRVEALREQQRWLVIAALKSRARLKAVELALDDLERDAVIGIKPYAADRHARDLLPARTLDDDALGVRTHDDRRRAVHEAGGEARTLHRGELD